jgi:2-keto-4-pentenoate hydratase/2-oxohepta-3-ene-1,7-dioic acid hydratase in catechol pathway
LKIARFLSKNGPRLGVVEGAYLVDLVGAAHWRGQSWLIPAFSDIRLFLAGGVGIRCAARELIAHTVVPRKPLADVRLLAPFESGAKILAHVVNYRGHDAEAGVKLPAKPFFFQKPGSSVANPGDPQLTHRLSRKLDHEVELGIVIGAMGRNIRPEDALAHVGGYTIVNDVSYRDLQMNEGFPDLNLNYGKNWTAAKGLDFACPIGPVLVLTDEMPEPYPLLMTCRVNGRIRQQANTAEMIYKAEALIAEVSRGMTLYPGDVIATGTCAGGGLADGYFLQPGDNVECEIEGIGILRNPVIADELTEQNFGAQCL